MRGACRGCCGPIVAVLAMMLTGCADYDGKAGLDKADYEDLIARRGAEQSQPPEEPPIPPLQPILAAPTPPDLIDQRRVTISVTAETPLRDVLFELARKAEVDLELDPRIDGGIIFTARERPFAEVVARIADLAGLRYTFADNVLRMELDEPYMQHYRVDALNLVRRTASTINASTDVFTAVGAGGAAGGNGSNATISGQSENDFWLEVTEGVRSIMLEKAAPPRLVAVTAPLVSEAVAPVAPTAAVPGAVTAAPVVVPEGEATAAAPTIAAPAVPGAPATAPAVPVVPAPLPVVAAPVAPQADEAEHYFTVNRQAGVITAFTTGRKHRKLAEYLDHLKDSLRSQVLIEAKVVEVTLRDEFRAGINWSAFGIKDMLFQANLATGVIPTDRILPTARLTASPRDLNLNSVIDLVSVFGTTRTLSSPRLTVTNNETALLKVAENEVYFTLDIDREINENGPDTITYTSELHTVPIGMLMSVQPSINSEGDQVTLNLRPTISRVVRQVEDPAVQLAIADINASNNANINVTSPIPVVEVREMDSVVTMGSGSVLVMGGLMQERADNEDEKVPGLGDVPVVGNAFKRRKRDTEVTELVIFLRATIVRDRDSVQPADVKLYDKFTPDPRPLAF